MHKIWPTKEIVKILHSLYDKSLNIVPLNTFPVIPGIELVEKTDEVLKYNKLDRPLV